MCKKIILYALLLLALPTISFGQYTKLLDFGGSINGSTPCGSLIYDGTYLYGMTTQGGYTHTYGNIYKVLPNGGGYTDLYGFSFKPNGSHPQGSLYYDGNYLYGMTNDGGSSTYCTFGCGAIFKISPSGTGYTNLNNFGVSYGLYPNGNLISDGTYLYGMAPNGGSGACAGYPGCGIIFKILPNGTGFDTLKVFNSATGLNPLGSLIYDGTYLYGMTKNGGTNDSGVVFKIKPDGSSFDTLLNFNGINGAIPYGSLIFDGIYLYGMTYGGGANHLGAIFKIMPNGTGYVKLLDFAGVTNGSNPYGDLVSDGTCLYGTTTRGGTQDRGILFKIMPDGTGYDTLHVFGKGTDGKSPDNGALLLVSGCLYGATAVGGSNNEGTIFSYCLTGAGMNQLADNSRQLSVYPNPANEIINLTISQFYNSAMNTIRIYNMMGECVKQVLINGNQISINIADFNAGVYFIKVTDTNGMMVTKKMIKN